MSDDVVANLRSQIARLSEANAFEALGVDYHADGDAVRAAFLAATKKYHPSRYARMDRDIVRLANEVFLQLKDAYTLLRDDSKRASLSERYAPSPSQPEPQETSETSSAAGGRPRFAERSRRAPAAPSAKRPSRDSRSGGGSGRTASQGDGSSSSIARAINGNTRRGVAARAISRSTVRGVGSRIPRPSRPPARRAADNPSGRERASGIEAASGSGQEQIEAVKASIADTIRRRNVDFEQALALSHAGKHEQARKLLQQVAIEEPKEKKYRLYLHYVWGQEHEAAGRFEDAGAEYRRALNIDPTFKRAYEALGRLETDKKGFFKKFFTR